MPKKVDFGESISVFFSAQGAQMRPILILAQDIGNIFKTDQGMLIILIFWILGTYLLRFSTISEKLAEIHSTFIWLILG